jgi:hypothetical protein
LEICDVGCQLQDAHAINQRPGRIRLGALATRGLRATMTPGAHHSAGERDNEACSFGTFGIGIARYRHSGEGGLPAWHLVQLLHDRERQAVLRLPLIMADG